MLVIARKNGERVMIGDDVVVTLIRGQNGQAKIGIEAPKGVKIVREELLTVSDEDVASSEAMVPPSILSGV